MLLFVALGAVTMPAEHLAIFLNSLTTLGPRHDMVGFHLPEL